jgi:DNA polymerase-3 subunit beta
MKIKIDKSIIENIVNNLVAFVEKKDNSLITSHIYIKADEKIIFKATDNETGIKIENENSEIIQSGEITINGKKLHDIIKVLKDDVIEIESLQNEAIIKQKNSIYKLPTFNSTDFPTLPDENSMPKIEINSLSFIDSLKKVLPVIDNNNPKYELNGALIDITKSNINIVSTDTKRLAIVEIENSSKENFSIIIPKKAINEIKKLFFSDIEIFYDKVNLILKSNNIKFFTKLINGKFPDYKRIIPNSFQYELKLNKQNFLSALKQITIISTDIRMTIKNNQFKIESISEENLKAKTTIDIESNIEEFIFAANSRYIYDFLNSIDSDEFILALNQPDIPFVLKDNSLSTIVMPLNI